VGPWHIDGQVMTEGDDGKVTYGVWYAKYGEDSCVGAEDDSYQTGSKISRGSLLHHKGLREPTP
jgi:hypothetical protein